MLCTSISKRQKYCITLDGLGLYTVGARLPFGLVDPDSHVVLDTYVGIGSYRVDEAKVSAEHLLNNGWRWSRWER